MRPERGGQEGALHCVDRAVAALEGLLEEVDRPVVLAEARVDEGRACRPANRGSTEDRTPQEKRNTRGRTNETRAAHPT